ncbi:MAG TPA: rhomboid family intramembrane serine protease [Anaeromyxobacteraceae bacterium]
MSITTRDDRPPPAPGGRLARLRGAPATTGLLVALALAFVASARDPALFERFAKVSGRVRAGEYWRLVTASFLHGGLLHIAVNGYALTMIGPTVERLYGAARFLLIFVVGGAAGFAASTVFVQQPSVGASAGLFALLGVLLGFAVRARRTLPRPARRAMIQEILTVAALNIALGLMAPFIDNAAHLGGFAGGLALGIVLRPRRPARTP